MNKNKIYKPRGVCEFLSHAAVQALLTSFWIGMCSVQIINVEETM